MAFRGSRGLTSLYRSSWAAVAIFAIAGLIGTLNHAMWRDEMNVWLIARDSPSFAVLLENIHYDRAHPGLWHLMVALLHGIFGHPMAMQIFHWLLGVGSIVLIWRASPFTQLQKWLFTFGYLPFFEYLLIARNYAIACFLLFTICTVWPFRRYAYWPIALLIGLLANTNIYALLIAIALGLTLALELGFERELALKRWRDVIASGLLIGVACAVSLYFILPPSDVANQALGEYFLSLDIHQLLRTIGRIFAGYYTVVPNESRSLDLIGCGVIAIVSFSVAALHLSKKPYALAFFLLGNGLMVGFTYIKFMPYFIRHYGNFYLVLIAAIWLAHHYPETAAVTRYLPILETRQKSIRQWFRRIFLLTLLVHLVGGVTGFVRDLALPYSASRTAAAYMKAAHLQDVFIVASRDAQMASLSGYLGRPFYYPEREAMGSYTLFFKGERREVAEREVIEQAIALLQEHPQILLVLSRELAQVPPDLHVEAIRSFTKTYTNEEYHLYWVRLAQPLPPARN